MHATAHALAEQVQHALDEPASEQATAREALAELERLAIEGEQHREAGDRVRQAWLIRASVERP